MALKFKKLSSGSGSATVTTKAGWKCTPVPTSGYLENVYFNINLTPEEIMNLIDKLIIEFGVDENYITVPIFGYMQDISYGCFMSYNKETQSCGIGIEGEIDDIDWLFVYSKNDELNSNYLEHIGFIGWNPDLIDNNGVLNLNKELIDFTEDFGDVIVVFLNSISSLISSIPFERIENETVELTGDYDGSPIDITENGSINLQQYINDKKIPLSMNVNVASSGGGSASIKTQAEWQGTTVPNTGLVENVYFNTNLSIEEVVDIITNSNISLIDGIMYFLLTTSDESLNLAIMVIGNQLAIIDQITYNIYFHNIDDPEIISQFGEPGWNPNITYPIAINSEVVGDVACGDENNKLTSLFSTTPFVMGESETIATLSDEYTSKKINITEDGTIDVLEMINNDKLIPTTINATSIINFIKGNISEYSNETLEKIRIGLFSNTMIKNVNLPKLTEIPKYAFYSCGNLQTINCPNITEIEGYAFYADYSLTDISFPYATKIGEYAFIMCSELINVDLPNVTAIGDSCFQSCSNLQTINSPLLTTIGTYAFSSCTSLTNINMPNLSSCKSSSFSACTNLESAIVPSATNISNYAFANCYVLKDVDFTSVKYIYGNAFEKCYELNNVKFPNLTSIQEYYPFKDCGNLTDLYFGKYVSLPGNAQGTISADVFTGLAGKITIHVPSSEVSRFTGNSYWKQLIDARAVSIVGDYTD